jgi:hypothetical protein
LLAIAGAKLSFLILDPFIDALGAEVRRDAEASVWRTLRGKGGFYCSLRFKIRGCEGWRFDPALMEPANDAAVRTKKTLNERLLDMAHAECLSWEGTDAVVIDNWRCLHARGPAPKAEGDRWLSRIYVDGGL